MCLQEKVAEEMQGWHRHGDFPYNTSPKNQEDVTTTPYILGSIPKLDPSVTKVTWDKKVIPMSTFGMEIPPPIIKKQKKKSTSEAALGNVDGGASQSGRKGKGKEAPVVEVQIAKQSETILTRKYKGPHVDLYPDVEWQNPANLFALIPLSLGVLPQ